MRVVSLIAGITLLAMGLAAVAGRRAEIGRERDRALEMTAEGASGRLDETIARVAAVLAVAVPQTDIGDLGDALALPVCSVSDGTTTCSAGSSVPADAEAVATALDASARRVVPAVVVARDPTTADGSGDHVVMAVDQGTRWLYVTVALDTTTLADDERAELVPVGAEPLLRPHDVDGDRVFAAPSMVEFEDGSWAVRVTAPGPVRMTVEERLLVGAELLVGAVLAALALGGMYNDHRSLQRRATMDGLTGLPNRAEFERRAIETLARLGRDGKTACLMVIDLDHFKAVNDTAGHDAGDRVLVAAAARLREAVRESDLVGRWGGDEFVVLLPGIAEPRAVPDRASMIADALAAPVGEHELTASVGAALFPVHGRGLDELLRAADRAMYVAKVQGIAHHLAES